MSETAADRVRAALVSGKRPARKDVEHSLREAWGVSARKARALSVALAPLIGSEDDASEDLRERMERLEHLLRL